MTQGMVDVPVHSGNCPPSKRYKMASHGQRGTATVEFGLLLPVLLLIVSGIIEFGMALFDKAVITNASREGARAGIVLRVPAISATEITKETKRIPYLAKLKTYAYVLEVAGSITQAL